MNAPSPRTPSALFIHRPSWPHWSRCLRPISLAGAVLGLLWTAPAQAGLSDYQTSVTSEPSLISYYTFEASDAVDSRGTNSGTLMGTTAFAAGARGHGTALSLTGAGRINLGTVSDFTFTNDDTGSIEAWVKAVDATAAGDVFNGALAVALAGGTPLPRAVRVANAAAALSATRIGAQPSAPTRLETRRFLTTHDRTSSSRWRT